MERLRRSRVGELVAAAADNLRDPARVTLLLLLAALVLRSVWLNVPARGLIFDESFYVNAARVILGWPASAHYIHSPIGLDPNTEHPPLGKVLMAASMSVLGDNGMGWRLPSLIAGIVALLAVIRIVQATDWSAWLPVVVLALVSLDNLTLVHGRIGTLDMLVVAPMLVGSLFALRRRWLLAGLAMGIALLMKLTALYGIGAVVLYVLLTEGPDWWKQRRVPLRDLVGPAVFTAVAGAVFIGGLAVLDARYTTFASPLDHINRMVSYGANLSVETRVGFCPEADSKPWQWLFNECQIQYMRVDETIRSGDKVVGKIAKIDFRGAMNPLLVGAIPLAALFTAWYAFRTRSRIALWAVAWAAANYLPYLALALFTKRIMYLYYVLPLVPAVAVGVALLLVRGGLPRPIRWAFMVAYVVGFAAYFPFRQIP